MKILDRTLHSVAILQAGHRLDRTLHEAPVLEFDDHSRFVFFSDLHRGDNGRADAFRANRAIFESALEHYEREGYTYIEVGDGDELWKNRDLNALRSAHRPIYRIMERLARAGRLMVLGGNHQLVPRGGHLAAMGPEYQEALLLIHRERPVRFLVTHGHQADAPYARAYGVVRLVVRYFWRTLQALGMRTTLPDAREGVSALSPVRGALAWAGYNQAGIEARIAHWLAGADHIGIICGHTHRPAFAPAGALPYFNTGSGIQPGYVTGLEIAEGTISLVLWTNRADGPGAYRLDSAPQRVVLAGPERLK